MDANIAELVDRLLQTHRRPDGKEYTYKELSQAAGGEFSPTYFAKLRAGEIKSPGRDGLLFLCKFFRIPASYFFPELDNLEPEPSTERERDQVPLRSLGVSEEVQQQLQALIKAIKQENQEGTK